MMALIIWALSFTAQAQTGDFEWKQLETFGGAANDFALRMEVDADSNVYLAGLIRDSIRIGGQLYESAGKNDLILMKLLPSGAVDWVQVLGGTDNDAAYAMTIGVSGSLYLSGYFNNEITVGGSSYQSLGQSDVFLAKFSPEGNPIWCRTWGSTGLDGGWSMDAVPGGGVFLGGDFRGEMIMGDDTLVSSGQTDGFLAIVEADGTVGWATSFGGQGQERVVDLVVDPAGDVFGVGYYTQEMLVEGDSISWSGGRDFFAMKWNSLGYVQWITTGQSPAQDDAHRCVADENGNFYVAGNHRDSLVIQGRTLPWSGGGDFDGLLIKLDPSGDLLWTHTLTDTARGAYRSLVSVNEDYLIVGGDQAINGDAEILIQSFNRDGELLHADTLINAGADYSYVLDWRHDRLYMGGVFQGSLGMDSLSATSAGGYDLFLAVTDAMEIEDGGNTGLVDQASLDWRIYPNPTSGNFSIQLERPLQQPAKLSLLNLQGSVLWQREISPAQDLLEVAIPSIPTGLYLLQLRTEEQVYAELIRIKK